MLFLLPEIYNHIVFLFISRIFVSIMRRLLCSFLLFAWVPGISAQTSVDYANIVEKEDSMKLLTIKLVDKPQKLLKQIIKRLHQDLKEQHGNRKYKIETTFGLNSSLPSYASCIYPVQFDNGLEIQGGKDVEDFICLGMKDMSQQDSLQIKDYLLKYLSFSPVHPNNHYNFGNYFRSPFVDYAETIKEYDVKAFKISYGIHSVYRINLKRRIQEVITHSYSPPEFFFGNAIDTVYFDCNTLRITEFKGKFVYKNNFPHHIDYRIYFQATYDEEEGSPVLREINYIRTFERKEDYMLRKATVKRIK